MSRSTIFGPGSTSSLTRLGQIAVPRDTIPKRLRDAARLENNKLVSAEQMRTRRYKFCTKCGSTTVLIGFDTTPSARVGLWGKCVDNKDYTHHKYVELAKGEYEVLRDLPIDERLNRWRFER